MLAEVEYTNGLSFEVNKSLVALLGWAMRQWGSFWKIAAISILGIACIMAFMTPMP